MNNKYQMKILVDQKKVEEEQVEDRSALIQFLLMVGIVFVAFFILLCLFIIIKLLKTRDKLRIDSYNRINNNNERNLLEPDSNLEVSKKSEESDQELKNELIKENND
jgi:hypothetical protein